MNRPRDLGSPPADTHHLSKDDEWVSPRDYSFHMDVSNRLTAIEQTLRTMQDAAVTAKADRRWLIGAVLTGMIASAAVTSALIVLLTNI